MKSWGKATAVGSQSLSKGSELSDGLCRQGVAGTLSLAQEKDVKLEKPAGTKLKWPFCAMRSCLNLICVSMFCKWDFMAQVMSSKMAQ